MKKTIPVLLTIRMLLSVCYFMTGDMKEKRANEDIEESVYVTEMQDFFRSEFNRRNGKCIWKARYGTSNGRTRIVIF